MRIHTRKNILLTIFIWLTLFVTSNANALLTSTDYVANSGDKWLTNDSKTGLQWLDVTLTTNQTFDQVRQGEWSARGFRYATKAELQALFVNAGTPEDGLTHYFETESLIALLGATIVTTDRLGTYGLIGSDYFDNDITLQSQPIGQTFSAQLGKLDFYPYIGKAHFSGGHPFSNEASPYYGSFLVRAAPVPEPESNLMLMLGLMTIIFFSYKKTRKS
ncbi:hypothetical protein [Methylophilus sp.]|uniref:hypothetical protein n=1 Tax=Methylophilus sp. TaxID=29541 RepID=UPI004036BC5F